MDGTTNTQAAGQEIPAANAADAQAAQTAQAPQAAQGTPEKVSALQKFINGLFGGKEADAAGTEASDAAADGKDAAGGGDAATDASGKEKQFTQTDLDAAVASAVASAVAEAKEQWTNEAAEAERLKKLTPEERAAEEQQKKDTEIAELKSQLLRKELRESAVKALEEEGFPVGLADLLDYSGKERMEESLKNMKENFQASLAAAIKNRLRGKTPEGLGNAASSENLLRDQIARNIRGL